MPKDKINSKDRPQRGRSSSVKRPADDLHHEGNSSKKSNKGKLSKSKTTVSDTHVIDEAMVEIATSVGDCVTAQAETIVSLNEHSDRINETSKDIKSLRNENKHLSKRLDIMDAAMKAALERISNVEKVANDNSHTLKNANLVIEGLLETNGENCKSKALEIFQVLEGKCQADDIITAYRVGQVSNDDKFPRPMVVKMADPRIKTVLMEQKGKLMHGKFNMIFLNDDLPPELKKQRRTLREICKFAHQTGYRNCKASGSKLTIEGKTYRFDTLHLLPKDLQMCNIRTRLVGDGLGFQSEVSYLSNFFPATVKIEHLSFSSAEQAFQFFKVRTCKREDTATQILSMSNPRKIKEAGDSIPSKAVWEANKEAFMRSIAYSKFVQNKDLQEKLLNTGNLPLYECTKNRWWGCGWRLDDPNWPEKSPPGLNKMGEILMDVRAAIRKGKYNEDALLKSPSAIIRAINSMDEKIREHAAVEKTVNPQGGTQERMDTNESAASSDSDDLLDPTDNEEDSINLSVDSAVSSTSSVKRTSRLDVTGADGKLDISKIRSWKLPKIAKLNPIDNTEHDDSYISSRTRGQNVSGPVLEGGMGTMKPKAQSTPQAAEKTDTNPNNSTLIEKVRDKLNKSGKLEK